MITLTDEQAAVRDSLLAGTAQVQVLHGLAGTGKTTLMAEIARARSDALMCSLTGKAASVLRRKTGMPAQTIHGLFYRLRDERTVGDRTILEFDPAKARDALRNKLVLIDECSMVSDRIAKDILATGAQIIACGDPGQLPPVEGEQFFKRPTHKLETVHRQALESPIIRQAYRVRDGDPYVDDGEDFRVGSHFRLPPHEFEDADIVLCWTNRTRGTLNRYCRELRAINPHGLPRAGEPVICLRNAPRYGLFNGMICTLLEPLRTGQTWVTLDVDGETVRVPDMVFEGHSEPLPPGVRPTTYFDFGYCITVHKSQGSEWDRVLLVDEYSRPDFRREWLYTGITRAAKNILVVR